MLKILPKYSHDYTITDFFYCISGLFKDYSKELNKELSKLFPNNYFIFLDSGRSALSLLLKTMHLPKKSEIAIPVNVCSVVVEAILRNNLTPLIIDIDKNLTMSPKDLTKKITKKTKVIILVYSYGNIPEIEKLSNIARENNCTIIEDMAQTFNPKHKNLKLGSLGEGSFISLDVTKHISSFNGGIFITKNKETYNKIKGEITKKESILKDLERISKLKAFWFLTTKSIYNLITRKLIKNLKDASFYEPSYKRLSNVGKALAYSQLRKLNKINHTRKKNALTFLHYLNNKTKVFIRSKTNPTFLFLPIGVKNKKRILNSELIDFPRPSPLLTNLNKYKKYWTDCPNAESLYEKLLLIPTYKKIGTETKKISNMITNG